MRNYSLTWYVGHEFVNFRAQDDRSAIAMVSALIPDGIMRAKLYSPDGLIMTFTTAYATSRIMRFSRDGIEISSNDADTMECADWFVSDGDNIEWNWRNYAVRGEDGMMRIV